MLGPTCQREVWEAAWAKVHLPASSTLWTLADHEAGKRTLDFDVHPLNIGAFHTFWKVAFVQPSNPHVVYIFLKQQLIAVDLQMNKVTESVSNGIDDGEPASLVLAWELPPSLRTTLSGPLMAQDSTGSTFHFDCVTNFFRKAYGSALADIEFHQLAGIALASLNKVKKTKENKFKLSECLFMQTFLEQTETKDKKYAPLNFYADTGSEKVLVFAEFHTDAVFDNERNQWALSSCKTLKRNYHGILELLQKSGPVNAILCI